MSASESSANNPAASKPTAASAQDADPQPERRQGPADRRSSQPDRRNPERVADEFAPRRNPEQPDRRKR